MRWTRKRRFSAWKEVGGKRSEVHFFDLRRRDAWCGETRRFWREGFPLLPSGDEARTRESAGRYELKRRIASYRQCARSMFHYTQAETLQHLPNRP